MSQNPGGPNYNPYGPGPANQNYPPVPGTTGYGGGQPPSGPNPDYGQYAPPPPITGPGDPTPNSSYGASYNPSYPQPTNPSAPPPPAGPYDPTVFNPQSGAGYPSYPAPGNPGYGAPVSNPGYGGSPSNPGYGAPVSSPGYPGSPSNPGFGASVTGPGYSGAPGGMPSVPPPRKKGGGRTVLISVIALLLIVGGVLSFVLYNNHQTTLHNDATATAQTQAQSTGTAQAFASATVNAQATATYVKTHYPFSSNLVLNDPLKDNSGVAKYGWDVGSGCAFNNGAYEATEAKAGFILPCAAESTNFSNFTFEIQMTIKSGGTDADGGLIFRANMNSDALYILFVGADGYYELDIRANSSGASTRKLSSGQVPGFTTGYFQVHTLGVVANGADISAYVDQHQVAKVTDSTYSSGQIGVIADYGTSSTTVAYSNAKVWQIS